MILSVEALKQYISTDEQDSVLEARLQALELLIRQYTNNNFQVRSIRAVAEVVSETKMIVCDRMIPLKVGDTVQISDSSYNDGTLCEVKSYSDGIITTDADLIDEFYTLVTKVKYPIDVQMGVVNMMKWELENREKVGIQSETISRHSVTYFNMDGDNSLMGFPKSLLGFLKPYKKARF